MGSMFDPCKHCSICVKNDSKCGWFGKRFYISNDFVILVEWVGCDRETNEKHDKDCVEEGFHVAKVKLDICGEGQRRYNSGVL